MSKLSHVIVFASDMKRSTAFYRDLLGFPLKFESPEWTEFGTGETSLALHKSSEAPQPSPAKARAGTCQFGINVEDLDAFHASLSAKGVACMMPPTKQDFGGRLAVYADPDGLPFSVEGGGKNP
jgi:lactoylglutathione lyase